MWFLLVFIGWNFLNVLSSFYLCVCVFALLPYHGHPAESGDALADCWQVVEEAAAAVSFAEALDSLDVIRDRLQQVVQLRLHRKNEGVIRTSRRMQKEMSAGEEWARWKKKVERWETRTKQHGGFKSNHKKPREQEHQLDNFFSKTQRPLSPST